MDGGINFKAIFDYGDAMRGVDDLTHKFEAAGMSLNDVFNFGRTFEGSKKEVKNFLNSMTSALASIKQQIRDAKEGMASDDLLSEKMQQDIKKAEADLKQARELIADFKFKQNSSIGEVLDPIDEAIRAKRAEIRGISDELAFIAGGGIEKEVANLRALKQAMEEIDATTEEGAKERERMRVELAQGLQKVGSALDFETDERGAVKITVEDLESLTSELIKTKRAAREAKLELKNMAAGDDLDALEEKYEDLRVQLEDEASGDEFLAGLRNAAEEAKQKLEELKKAEAESADNRGKGEENLKNLEKEEKRLDALIKGVKERLKDPDISTGNVFNGLTQGVQGLMGAYTAASGVLAQFGADEKDLQKVQTQLQGSMSLLMGLQQVYNALQSESAFRTQVLDKVMLALTKTYKKVAASSFLAKLGVAGLAAGLVIAVGAAVASLSKYAKRQKEIAKVHGQAAASVAEQIVAYMRLQKQWKEAEGDLKKQNQLLADSKWGKVGADVRGFNDAQRILVDESDKVIDALMAQAEAAALYGVAAEKAEKGVKNLLKANQLDQEVEEGKLGGNIGDWIVGMGIASATGMNIRDAVLLQKKNRANDKRKEYEKSRGEIATILDTASQKEDEANAGGLLNEEQERLKEAGHKVSELMKDQKRERERLAKDMEFDVRQKRIEAMKDSTARELSQLSLDHDKEMEALKRQQEDRLKQLQDEQKQRALAGNPNLKDYQAGSSIRELPKEEAERFAEQSRLLNEAFAEAKADLMEKYGSLEERRKRLSDKWQKDIDATTDADVRAILEKEAKADIANFEYENVEANGTTQQVYAALKAKLEAEADLIADDAQRTIALASAEVQLAELKYKDAGNYRNYEKELEATNAIYDAKIREAKARKDVAGAEVLEKEKMSALMKLRREYTAMYDLIFSSAETMTNNNLAKAIVYTQQAIKDAKGDAKELAELYERLRGFKAEQNTRNTGWGFGGIGTGFRSIMNARGWQSRADNKYVSEEDKKRYQQKANAEAESGFASISKGVTEVSEALDGMGDALEKMGDDAAEVGKIFKAIGKTVKDAGSFFSNLDADFKVKDKGQVINQAIQGTLELISMVGAQIEENKKIQEEWNRTIEESAHKLTMLEIEKLSYKQANIFGVEDPFKKATDSANVYFKSMEEVAKLTDKLNEGRVQTGTKKGTSGENVMKGMGAGAAVGAAIGTAVGGWAAGVGTIVGTAIGAIVGGITGLVGGMKEIPVFESLEEHYKYLFDPKTYELNPELLADYDKLDESTKQIVDHWDEIREKALKSQEDLKANLVQFTGDIGTKLRDTLVEAWTNRRLYQSVDKFKEYVNDTIAEMLQQKAFNAVFGGLFEQVGKAMEASFIGPDADNDITDDVDMLFQKLPGYLEAYDSAMSQAQKQMEAQGYEGFFKRKENADATTASYQQISETTGSVIAGGVTAIRLLMEQRKAADNAEGLQINGIRSSLDDIRGLSLISIGYLENIANYTSVLPDMREALGIIERRTRSL